MHLGRKATSTSSKDWKGYLFVQKYCQDTKSSFLDYYRDSKKRWQKQQKSGSIELNFYCVSLAHNCSYQFPLKIITKKEGELYLAASTFGAMNKWYNCLQMNCYLVPSAQGRCHYISVCYIHSVRKHLLIPPFSLSHRHDTLGLEHNADGGIAIFSCFQSLSVASVLKLSSREVSGQTKENSLGYCLLDLCRRPVIL